MFRHGFEKVAGLASSLKRAVGLKPNAYKRMGELVDRAARKASLSNSLVGSVQGKAIQARAFHQLSRIERLAHK